MRILSFLVRHQDPLSMHLANLGIKVANYPILHDTEIPEEIMELKGKVPMVGLTIDIDTLMELRRERLRSFEDMDEESIDERVAEELDNAYRIFARLKCLVIDVTMDDIETIGNTITCGSTSQSYHHRLSKSGGDMSPIFHTYHLVPNVPYKQIKLE